MHRFTEHSEHKGSPSTRCTHVLRALGAHTFPEHSVHTSSIPTGRLVCRIHAGTAQWQQVGQCIYISVVSWCVEYMQEMLDGNRSAGACRF